MMKKKKIIIPIVILSIVILILLITLVVGNSNSPSLNEHEVGDTWVEYDEITEQPEGYDENYFNVYGITEDDVYESYDAIDFDLINPGAFVFYRGEHGEIIHMINTPALTEKMIISMWNWVNSFEDFTVDKTVLVEVGSNHERIMMEDNSCLFNKHTKSYTIKNVDSAVKLPLIDATSLNTNEEFLTTLLECEGLNLNWTIYDKPITHNTYNPRYAFSNVNSDMILNSMNDLINEYAVENVTESKIEYVVDDSKLLFINMNVSGLLQNGEPIYINVNYAIMMC